MPVVFGLPQNTTRIIHQTSAGRGLRCLKAPLFPEDSEPCVDVSFFFLNWLCWDDPQPINIRPLYEKMSGRWRGSVHTVFEVDV